jgi:hypothetical protein
MNPIEHQKTYTEPDSMLDELLANSVSPQMPAPGEILIGVIVDKLTNGLPVVQVMDDSFEGVAPMVAQSICSLDVLEVGRQCAVTVTGGSQQTALVLGQLQSAVIGLGSAAEIKVSQEDGMIEIQSEKEIAFRCGDATFRMTSEGLVEMRGNRVVSHSTGLNRIRGGSVRLN